MFSKLGTIISIARLYLSVTYQLDRFSNGDRRDGNNKKARLPHPFYLSTEFSRGKEPPADAILGRMHATGFSVDTVYPHVQPSRGAAW